MPTYEFRCPTGHDFEKFYRKISDAPAEVFCPECGALSSRQMSAGAGLLFKGSGFYITDYGKDGKGARKPEDGVQGSDKKTDSSAKSPDGSSKSDGAAAKPAAESKSSSGKSTGTSGKSGGSSGGAA